MLSKHIRPDVTDELRGADFDTYLRFFDDGYFEGMRTGTVFGYVDYATCRPILDTWAGMLEEYLKPRSVLDVGAAYGFVVEYFRDLGRAADGVEPSDFARARAAVPLHPGHLPHDLPDLGRRYEVVTCTEVLEHVPTDSVAGAFAALVGQAERYVVCLVEMGDWDQYHEDPSHIHLRPRDWWLEQAGQVEGAAVDEGMIRKLDGHAASESMGWKGRFLVLRVDDGEEVP